MTPSQSQLQQHLLRFALKKCRLLCAETVTAADEPMSQSTEEAEEEQEDAHDPEILVDFF